MHLLENPYFGVGLLFVFALTFPALFLLLSKAFGPRSFRREPMKYSTYESGVASVGEPRNRFSVKYFMYGMIFIVFDLEVVFVYPWTVLVRRLGVVGFVEISFFLLVLSLGLVYVWRKGAFQWE